MFDLSRRAIQVLAWSLAFLVCLLAFIAWMQGNAGSLANMTSYQLFPLLGLLAFSLMWTHYLMGVAKEVATSHPKALHTYYVWTGYAVLALICLHPGLLIYQLFRDGQGLPPGSYEKYVGPGLGWVALLGTVSLLIFLAFELHRFFGRKKWWHYIADLSDLAMLAILYHGLRLGSQLQTGWYRFVWWFYAVVFILILIRKYGSKLGLGFKRAQP